MKRLILLALALLSPLAFGQTKAKHQAHAKSAHSKAEDGGGQEGGGGNDVSGPYRKHALMLLDYLETNYPSDRPMFEDIRSVLTDQRMKIMLVKRFYNPVTKRTKVEDSNIVNYAYTWPFYTELLESYWSPKVKNWDVSWQFIGHELFRLVPKLSRREGDGYHLSIDRYHLDKLRDSDLWTFEKNPLPYQIPHLKEGQKLIVQWDSLDTEMTGGYFAEFTMTASIRKNVTTVKYRIPGYFEAAHSDTDKSLGTAIAGGKPLARYIFDTDQFNELTDRLYERLNYQLNPEPMSVVFNIKLTRNDRFYLHDEWKTSDMTLTAETLSPTQSDFGNIDGSIGFENNAMPGSTNQAKFEIIVTAPR